MESTEMTKHLNQIFTVLSTCPRRYTSVMLLRNIWQSHTTIPCNCNLSDRQRRKVFEREDRCVQIADRRPYFIVSFRS